MNAVRILLVVSFAAIATVAGAEEPLYLQPRLIDSLRSTPARIPLTAVTNANWFTASSERHPMDIGIDGTAADASFELVATTAPATLLWGETAMNFGLRSITAAKSGVDQHLFQPVDWSQGTTSTIWQQPLFDQPTLDKLVR